MDREGVSGEAGYYEILGIRKDASFSDVRSAYRQLALKWHPDRCAKNQLSAEEAKQKFQSIQEAYSVLSDQGKRSMYDAGALGLLDDEEDEGMKDFMCDLFSMMEQQKNEPEETLEDLQRTFVEMFGEDLAKMADNDDLNANDFRAFGFCP